MTEPTNAHICVEQAHGREDVGNWDLRPSLLHSDFLLVADKWGALFIAELRLLIVVASLVVEHRP